MTAQQDSPVSELFTAHEHVLLAVRHGETAWSAEGRFTTYSDVPLSQAGRLQAWEMAETLSGLKIDSAYTSPLSRARNTAEVALSQVDVSQGPDVDDRLREAPAGPFEGQVLAYLRRGDDQLAREFQAYDSEADPLVPPGAEHPMVTAERIGDFLETIEGHPGRYVVFSHGKALRIMLCLLRGLSPLWNSRFRVPTGCAITAVRREGQWLVVDESLPLARPPR